MKLDEAVSTLKHAFGAPEICVPGHVHLYLAPNKPSFFLIEVRTVSALTATSSRPARIHSKISQLFQACILEAQTLYLIMSFLSKPMRSQRPQLWGSGDTVPGWALSPNNSPPPFRPSWPLERLVGPFHRRAILATLHFL